MNFNEFLVKYNEIEKPASTIYHKYFSKNGAKLFSFIFVKGNVTPNTISFTSFLLLIFGCVLLFANSIMINAIGIVLLQISYIFDCSDGIVARYFKMSSSFGAYLDVLLDRVGGLIFLITIYTCYLLNENTNYPTLVGISLVSCYFYHLSSSFRPYYFPKLKGYMKKKSQFNLAKAYVKFAYEFIDTGIFYLILSLSLVFGWLETVAIFYGIIGASLFSANLFLLYKIESNNKDL